MWMMTTTGFFSVVSAATPGEVMIRARRRADLASLLRRFKHPQKTILRTEHGDYLFRVYVPAKLWAKWAGALALDALAYTNFKDEVSRTNPRRAKTYLSVWNACREIESEASAETFTRLRRIG